jgi:hypothetical protein
VKHCKTSYISGKLAGATLFLGLTTTPALMAQFECKQELMAGAWAIQNSVTSLEREGVDIFPTPGPFSFVGLVVFDPTGRVTIERHTNSTPSGVARPDLTLFFDGRFTVNPDCTGRLAYTLRDLPSDHPFVSQFGLNPGQVVIDLDTVCANGQRECWAVPTVPSFQIGIATLKKIDPFDERLHAKVDRVLRRLGLIP